MASEEELTHLVTELHYAVSFDEPKATNVPLDIIWPFARPDLVAQLRRYEIPGDTIPLRLGAEGADGKKSRRGPDVSRVYAHIRMLAEQDMAEK
ncbi:hypothetical protein [Bifidobacterium vespertilionis]|uniref:hypothetical protein n=1 Tax=Bifidobacterium vespertilionis TaxID=2562524 RepID=UPI001BDCC332|nr:hypothetical protein [Bifidobacterium vespertilionis]MBT1179918.1 hypothetical protein [Bifidobacterium vespertilionis]